MKTYKPRPRRRSVFDRRNDKMDYTRKWRLKNAIWAKHCDMYEAIMSTINGYKIAVYQQAKSLDALIYWVDLKSARYDIAVTQGHLIDAIDEA